MIIGFLSGGFIGLVAGIALMNMATASFICVQTVHICCLIAHPETTGVRIAKQGSTGKRSMSWVVKRNVEDNSHVSWRKPKSIY